MFGHRAPWWMYVIAASYLSAYAIVVYVEFRGAEDPGIEFESILNPGPAVAVAILPGSPSARAGIERCDRVVSFDGRPIAGSLYWGIVVADFEIGKPHRIGIDRGGRRQEILLTLERRTSGP